MAQPSGEEGIVSCPLKERLHLLKLARQQNALPSKMINWGERKNYIQTWRLSLLRNWKSAGLEYNLRSL